MLFRCIVADPPWKTTAGRPLGGYVKNPDGSQPFGPRGNHSRMLDYPCLNVEDILALRPPSAANCHLYLWTINKYLREAFSVIDAWGFTYSTALVWAKNPMGGGLGGCYGLATEYCLFARKGVLKAEARIGRNWFNWKRPYTARGKPRHSAKPPEFFDMVESVSPGPRLEMFARSPRAGWVVWGDEVESPVEIKKAPKP